MSGYVNFANGLQERGEAQSQLREFISWMKQHSSPKPIIINFSLLEQDSPLTSLDEGNEGKEEDTTKSE